MLRLFLVLCALTACSSSHPTGDASTDASSDVITTDAVDGGEDAPIDATDDTGGECPPSVVEGDSCEPQQEGVSCGPPCTSACQFCNILLCSGGTWEHLEAFPAPCFTCGDEQCVEGEELCRHTVSDIGGAPDEYVCGTVPSACSDDPTCECILKQINSDSCEEDEDGNVTLTFEGG